MNRECPAPLTDKIHPDCVTCFLEQASKLIKKYKINDDVAGEIVARFKAYVKGHPYMQAPEASCLMHRYFKTATGIRDPYSEEKKVYNELVLSLEEDIRNIIQGSENPFQTALRYALAGNIIDFGPRKPFNVFRALSEAVSKDPDIDHSHELEHELRNASTVLYLGDNAGEIVLDKIFIETIGHPDLWFAVRGFNIINDVTTEDAERAGIPEMAKVISNGYDAPSTLVSRCSPEFRRIYDTADVIISKGQGNLEGLINVSDKKIFFLLMVKCNVIAERLDVRERNVVVLYNQNITAPD